ncbi:ATP-binding protein [uncultured Odoribacter sp.]|uniref:ATP-binding protein n=1 Tax=uncultured Odoribacter sp. TaxID=876416 RepID=UPI00262F9CC0|nr:ATP-binding protein [uncultured Odoribacter sp.]
MNELNTTIVSLPDNITEAEKFIEYVMTAFEIPEHLQARITLPVIEAVTNSILFGNRANLSRRIYLNAVKDKEKLSVMIEEEGEGIDIMNLPDFNNPEQLMEETNRGFYLLINLPDELLITRHGNKIVMAYFLDK